MASTLVMDPIPSDHAKAALWQSTIVLQNGQTIDGPVAFASFASQYGKLLFGAGNDGRIGWAWQETGGGGSVSAIFALEPGKKPIDGLWIGFLPEARKNMGPNKQLCIVGGFQKPGEGAHAAHVREFKGETGGEVVRDRELKGLPMNGNRLYFVADPDEKEGLHAFAVEVPFADLIPALDGTKEHGTWQPKAGAKLVFLPWREAVQQSADVIGVAAVGRLLAEIL